MLIGEMLLWGATLGNDVMGGSSSLGTLLCAALEFAGVIFFLVAYLFCLHEGVVQQISAYFELRQTVKRLTTVAPLESNATTTSIADTDDALDDDNDAADAAIAAAADGATDDANDAHVDS